MEAWVRGVGWWRQLVLAVGCLSVTPGCGGDFGGEPGSDEVVAQDEEPTYFYTSKQLFNDTFVAHVCFLQSGFATERSLFRSYVEQSWEAFGGLDFQGWDDCTGDPQAIPVEFNWVANDPSVGGKSWYGRGGRTDDNPNAQVRIWYSDSHAWFGYITVHEMGHVAGLIHEHQRPDRDPLHTCGAIASPSPDVDPISGETMTSPYDYDSIVNYCRDFNHNGLPDYKDDPEDIWQPTPLDVSGYQMLYGPSAALRTTDSAFVIARGVVGTITPAPSISYNSMGGKNTVTKVPNSTGRYTVSMPRVQTIGGTVQVSAIGSARRCKVDNWLNLSDQEAINVRCFNQSGNPIDSDFSATYLKRTDTPGVEGGYAYANQPTTASYAPNATYAWNSTGQGITVSRSGTGQYSVDFAGQSLSTATPLVSAVGVDSSHCKVSGFSASSVSVRCFTSAGSAVDSQFTVSFTQGSHAGTVSYSSAYLDQPAPSGSYAPSTQRTFHKYSVGGTNAAGRVTIARSGGPTGAYRATFTGFPSATDQQAYGKVNFQVTTHGTGSEYCSLGTYGATSTTNYVDIGCFTPSGARTDARFTVSFSTPRVLNWPRTLATSAEATDPSSQVAVDSAWVYYAEAGVSGDVRKVRLDGLVKDATGSLAQVVLATGQPLPNFVATNTNYLFWANAYTGLGGLMRREKGVGSPLQLYATAGGEATGFIAANETDVFFTTFGTSGAIKKISVNGGTPTVLTTSNTAPIGLAIDATNVYFTTSGGSVKKVTLGGQNVAFLAQGESAPKYVTVSGSNVYWLNTGSGTLRRIGTGGTGLTTLVAGIGTPRGLAVDANAAYFADGATGSIQRYTFSDGKLVSLATGQNMPYVVGMDAGTSGFVYFGNTDHSLLKVPKQP